MFGVRYALATIVGTRTDWDPESVEGICFRALQEIDRLQAEPGALLQRYIISDRVMPWPEATQDIAMIGHQIDGLQDRAEEAEEKLKAATAFLRANGFNDNDWLPIPKEKE